MKINLLRIAGSILMVLMVCQQSYAQDMFIPIKPTSLDLPLGMKFNEKENAKEGSPYLTDDWKEIKMTRKDGSSYLMPQGKYNVFVEGLVVNFCCEQYYIAEPREIESFEFDNRLFVGMRYGNKFGFYEELSTNGNLTLLSKPVCLVTSGSPSNGIVAATPDRYHVDQQYCILINDGTQSIVQLEIKGRKLEVSSAVLPEFATYLDDQKRHRIDQDHIKLIFDQFRNDS